MKPSDVINSPDRWTTGAFARNGLGLSCAALDPRACQWCLMGAIIRAYPDDDERQDAALKAVHGLINERDGASGISAGYYNDNYPYEAVRSLLLEAGL